MLAQCLAKRVWQQTVAVIAAIFAVATQAQTGPPLADKVPANAVFYLGWAGTDAMGPAYQASDMAAFVDQSNLREVLSPFLPRIWQLITGHIQADGFDVAGVAYLRKALPMLQRHPVAISLSGVSISTDGTPSADLGLICDAGPDAGELQAALKSLLKGNDHLHVLTRGSLVTVGVERPTGDPLEPPLTTSPRFSASMKSLQANPAIACYLDAAALLQDLDESAQKDPDAAIIWPKVIDALGLTDTKMFGFTAGFDQGCWMTTSLLESPAPRRGLLAVIKPAPIDPTLLARIPVSAGSVSVFNFDAAMLFDTIAAAMSTKEKTDRLFHQVTGATSILLGRNFRRQILASLGPQWVMYSDIASHTLVVLNHPVSVDDASDGLVSALFGIVNLARTQIHTDQPLVSADQKTVRGLDLTTAVTSVASPTMAVKKNILYLGMSVDSVLNAATQKTAAAGTDIMQTADFSSATNRLGMPLLGAFSYCDLPITAAGAYAAFDDQGKQLRQTLSLFNIDIPDLALPSLAGIRRHLSPAISAAWADEKGIYYKAVCPFPGSAMLLADPQLLSTGISTVSAVATLAAQYARHHP